RSCLSDRLQWRPVPSTGQVLTRTVIRHSTDAYFQARRPILIGTAQLDCGPVIFARLSPDCGELGARVRLFNMLDRSGEQVFVAMPEDAEMEANVVADPNREVKGRTVLVTGADGGIGRALVEAFEIGRGSCREY